MKNSTLTTVVARNSVGEDMFSELAPLDVLDIKKDRLATQLTALMIHSGKSRTEMAEALGWKKSRVTRVLSGRDNLTVKTVCEFSSCLGYDFDVIFHGVDEPSPRQPWEIKMLEKYSVTTVDWPTLNPPVVSQSIQEIFIDFINGKGKKRYFSFDTSIYETSLPEVSHKLLPEPKMSYQNFYSVPVTHNIRR